MILSATAVGGPKRSAALPTELSAAVRSVTDAAKRKDFIALRALMIDAFTWSFGGDENADQAITEWKKDDRYMKELVRVLSGKCRSANSAHVECPGRGDLSFRAGFVSTDRGWKLEYFVEGD